MMHDALPLRPEVLLEHAGWVRALAGRLLADAATADDATQEALVVALGGGPGDVARARPWLAGVLRNVVRRMRRASGRRDERERAVARKEALEATDEIVARASLQRAVVDAVLALAEPYRTTVLMRFFDELPTGAIASKRGEPVETVRTRLKRGLAMLREKLSRELDVETSEGTRRTGLGALVLLFEPVRTGTVVATASAAAGTGTGTVVAITGGWLMTTLGKSTIVAALVVAGAVTAFSLLPRRGTKNEKTAIANLDVPRANAAATSDRAGTDAVATRDPLGASRSAADRSSQAPTDSTAAPPPGPSRWSDVTKDTWERLVHEDEGTEVRAAVAGLESESLDLIAFLHFVDSIFADSFIVPGAGEVKAGGGKKSVNWVQVYENANGERLLALPVWSHDPKSDGASILLHANFWARESGERLGLPSSNLNSWLSIHVRRNAEGRFTGMVLFNPGPFGYAEGSGIGLKEMTSKVQRLNDEKRLPSSLHFDFTDGLGRRTWQRSGASQALSADECERLTELFELLERTAKDAEDAESK